MLKQLLSTVLLIPAFVVFAQTDCEANWENGWCWGSQPDLAKEKNVLYTDAFKLNNFADAAPHLDWLLENTPNLNKSIYINGVKIYENLANIEEDDARKLELINKTLQIYDQRIEYFGEEATVLNYKAYVAYKLLKNISSRYQELMDLFTRSYELNGNGFFANNIIAYMDVLRRYKAVGNELADDQVFDIYFGLSDVMDYKAAQGNAVPDAIRENVDKLLLMIVPEIDCEIVINDFGPKLDANPEINMAKKIFSLMLTGKCTEDPLALKAAILIDDNEPSYGVKLFIAQRSLADGDKEAALRYYEDALPLTDENVKKADLYLRIARIKSSQGLKTQAREYANRALSVDPSTKDAYTLIGDLYMNSFSDCAGLEDMVKDRAVYIAAYEMYQRAGNASKMASAKAQFPSIEDLFNGGYEEGQSMAVGCWINTTVTLARRPN